jgi:phenylacetate-CoA ligase
LSIQVVEANRDDQRYPPSGPKSAGLEPILERARRSSFFRRKLEAAGIETGRGLDWAHWLAIAPTAKDELRAVASPASDLWIVGRDEVVEYWRSGGVTGRPLFYPRTAGDLENSLQAFERCLRFAGVTAADTFMCSLPIGVHPAGQQTVRAAERIGAAAIWAGAGSQTPSAAQVELVHELGATVWCGMPSFGTNLGHIAEAAGRPLADSRVRLVVTTAEMLTPAKRALLERLWGARVVDVFGMSEITLMGVECRRRPGLHVWREHSFCEVLDGETLKPAAPGEIGVLCVTPVAGGEAIPFLRWLSGDVVRIELGCDCDAAAHPRLVHSGRTLAFSKVRGVNLNHAEVEDALYGIAGLLDFRVSITADERILVEVEVSSGACGAPIERVQGLFSQRFGVRAEATAVERGTIAKSVDTQVKAQRFVDRRPQP